jgi:hypothetical protein
VNTISTVVTNGVIGSLINTVLYEVTNASTVISLVNPIINDGQVINLADKFGPIQLTANLIIECIRIPAVPIIPN